MARTQVKMKLDQGLLDEIDFLRGEGSRGAWVERACRYYINARSYDGRVAQALTRAALAKGDDVPEYLQSDRRPSE